MRCCKIDRSKLVVVSLVVLLLSSVFIFGSAAAAQNNNGLFSMFGSLFSSIGNAAKSITGLQVSDSGTGSDKGSGVPGSVSLGGGGTGEIACGDSDGGLNYDVKGTVTYTGTTGYVPDTAGGNTYTDKCGGTAVNEFYCENVELKTVSASCKYGCKDGACIKEPGCVSDNECLSETTKYCDGANACTSATNYKCDNGECVEASSGTGECTICPNGCKDGACVKAPSGRTPPCGSYGDVDLNGYVSTDDATFLSDYLSGKVQLSAEQKKLADVNNDGTITVSDSLAIINYAKFGGTFPVCSAEAKCTDSDGGKDYYVKGTTTGNYPSPSGVSLSSETDTCDSDVVVENFCFPNSANRGWETYECDLSGYSCFDGACVSECPTGYFSFNGACISGTLVKDEKQVIKKNDYLLLGSGYRLRYLSSSKSSETSPKVEFLDTVTSNQINVDYSAKGGQPGVGAADAQINIGGGTYRIWNASSDLSSNFNIRVDLNGDGKLEGTATTTSCTDSDGGINYYVKGTVTATNWGTSSDSCFGPDSMSLNELYCENGIAKSTQYACPNGCSNGACIKTEVPTLDLANYPYPFVKDGKMNSIIVVGDSAVSSDVIASVDIASSFQSIGVPVGGAKLASEVADYKAQNVIAVGTACNNAVIAGMLGNPADCTQGMVEGRGIVKLLSFGNGNAGLVVTGYSDMDRRRAAKVLANYKAWQGKGALKGTEVWVKGTSFDDITVVAPEPTAPSVYTTKSEYQLGDMIEVYTKLPQNMDCDQYAVSSDGREFQLGSAGCFADGISFSINSIRLGVGKWQIKIVAKYSTTTTVASANTADSLVLLSPPFVINAVAVPAEGCPARIELFTDKDAYNVGERGKLTVKTYNGKGKLQGYDLLGKIEPALITTPVAQNTLTTEVSYSSFSTKPSGVYEEEGVMSSSSGINGEPGMYTITVRQEWGCDDTGNVVSAVKNIEILPLGTGPGVPIDRVYNVKIAKGWNLVSLLPMIAIGERVGSSSSTCSFISGDDGLAEYAKNNIFGYDSINRKYIKLGDLIGAAGNIPNFERDGYIVNTQINGYWLRSSEDCSMTADWSSVSEEDTMFNIIRKISSSGYKLARGWNFFSILPEMEGKTLDDVKGSCQVQRAYGYDAAGRKWVAISDSAAHHNDVGYGFIMRVADDCVLGPSSALPPPLPEESAAVKAAKLTTRAVSTTSAAN